MNQEGSIATKYSTIYDFQSLYVKNTFIAVPIFLTYTIYIFPVQDDWKTYLAAHIINEAHGT